jgi:hypothetical protein
MHPLASNPVFLKKLPCLPGEATSVIARVYAHLAKGIPFLGSNRPKGHYYIDFLLDNGYRWGVTP